MESTLGTLREDQITKLASRKGAKRIAVENFLGSMEGLTLHEAVENLMLDTGSYGWNAATTTAIRMGIDAARRYV